MKKVKDDGLLIDSAGCWAERKYDLIDQYANMFATSMKNRWDNRIYIDLFSSSGYAQIRGTDNIVMTSPLIAADVRNKFDKYIFCDCDPVKIDSLKRRVTRDFPEIIADYVIGDINDSVNEVLKKLPKFSSDFTGLTFCLVDPYKLDNLSFETILSLSKYRIDFMILIPSFMDINRNEKNYIKEDSNLVSKFLDTRNWRELWEETKNNGMTFGTFFVKLFNQRMESAGFLKLYDNEFVLIRNPENKSPLYHLAFYSKSELGKKFWNNAIKGTSNQIELF
ncbi:MAG: three-Cys-motif partner protein TcmP [Melioribacteraceae bacterium]|nr:three-Cys-motif partner protein TcmP [Melioribacteraceae bacterium]MCF8353926.1 three-Cys-motif partner protein TcmP [Melioribacteraceae bacterium]MCF8392683.1 three-Cys-motif partner protein TcmP [Melioribacteraceae bacterium]MCF8417704.1 three-Cys-motif partner protein TcmP [Melioribacteraceae bacterium]